MIINKKIKRTMLESKSQYIGSLVLIIISCLFYTMFNQLTINMKDINGTFARNYMQEDASFVTDKKLTDMSALETKFNLKIEETKTIDYAVTEEKTLRIFSQNDKVNKSAVLEGTALGDGNVLLDPAYAKANKLNIGEQIQLYGKDFKVAGYMSLPNYIYTLKSDNDLLNDPNSFGTAVITKTDFAALNRGNSFYSIRFEGDRDNIKSQIANLKNELKQQGLIILKWTDATENPRIMFVDSKIQGISQISSAMPIAILLLTCILTGIVMWRMIKRESVIIGSLYALGYRKKEIVGHYIRYPLFIALTGGIIGTILGAFALRPMLTVMVSYFNMPVDEVYFNISYIVISILLPVIFLMVCSYFVVNRALKYSPVELMRGGKETGKVGFLERKVKLDRLKFNTKFKVREQLRSLSRSIFLLFGVALATMLLLFGFAAKSSIGYLMNESFENTYAYKYHYVYNSFQQGNPAAGEAFSESVFSTKSNEDLSFAIYGIAPDTKLLMLKDKAGNQLDTNQVIITRSLADKLQIKAGDRVNVINKLDSKEYSITVDQIAETYAGSNIYMPLPRFNQLLNYPTDSYIGIWSKEKLDIPEDQLFAMVTIDDLKKAYDSMTQPIQAAMGAMAFLSFIIGLVVIYVVTSLIIEENRSNISLMKVMGYRKKEVYSLILNSSSFLVVLGYILGVPLLLGSLKAMFDSVTKTLTLSFPIRVDYIYVIIGFVIIYATYEVSKALSKRKINKISMAEALKAGAE